MPAHDTDLRELQPEGKELPFTYQNGRVYFEVPRLDIHSIVEVVK